MILNAFKIAFKAHRGQKDKAGKAYIWHPIHVALHTKTKDGFIAGLLHDVMEDSEYTAEDLIKAGISEHIVEALKLLTHEDGVEYMAYVSRLRYNPIAKEVKIADLKHNSDLSRIPKVTEKDLNRAKKYKDALALLERTEAS